MSIRTRSRSKQFALELIGSSRFYLQSKKEEGDDLPISKHDIAFSESLGDTEIGYQARGEIAEMYDVVAEKIDTLILNRIYGDESC